MTASTSTATLEIETVQAACTVFVDGSRTLFYSEAGLIPFGLFDRIIIIIIAFVVDRFYIALFSAVEQTHCALVSTM